MKFSDFNDVRYNVSFPAEADMEGALEYASEFYLTHCPDVEFVEIDRKESTSPGGALSDLWGEQVGGLKIKRKIIIKCFPEFSSEEKQSHTKHGVETDQDIRFVFCITQLRDKDLIPEIGDHVVYKHIDYEIVRSYIDPNHIWGMTNRPMYISCASNIYRPGDRRPTGNSNTI